MNIPPEALTLVGSAGKWLTFAGPPTVAIWRLLSSDRSLLYALLPWLGRKVDARKRQEALLTETQKAFAAQLKSLGRTRDLLSEKLLKATSAKRPLLERDLEYVEQREREATIKFAAFKDLAALPVEPVSDGASDSAKAISSHWMDQFNDLIRKRNEEWRANLLKDALVREACHPGSISTRALWLIGTLEPEKFEYLAALLNLASEIGGRPFIPGKITQSDRRIVPGIENKAWHLSRVVVALSDTGLLRDIGVIRRFGKDQVILGSYAGLHVAVTVAMQEEKVPGVIFTSLGETIASLYRPTPNDLGRELFDAWVKSCRPPRYSVRQL